MPPDSHTSRPPSFESDSLSTEIVIISAHENMVASKYLYLEILVLMTTYMSLATLFQSRKHMASVRVVFASFPGLFIRN